MSQWVTKGLFYVTLLIATLLLLCVIASPLVDSGQPTGQGVERVVALFARDTAVRRTALATAIGLYATAVVFFRTGLATPDAFRQEAHDSLRRRVSSR